MKLFRMCIEILKDSTISSALPQIRPKSSIPLNLWPNKFLFRTDNKITGPRCGTTVLRSMWDNLGAKERSVAFNNLKKKIVTKLRYVCSPEVDSWITLSAFNIRFNVFCFKFAKVFGWLQDDPDLYWETVWREGGSYYAGFIQVRDYVPWVEVW